MNSPFLRTLGCRLFVLAAALPVAAQAQQAPGRADNLPPGAVVQPLEESGPGAELRRNLTTLGQNPRSIEALIGAGRAALEMGDAQAAITFFARADEISPRDARVKTGMASAFVHLQQPEAALSLFAEAVALGAPEASIAGDRGLAHDIMGDPARAQRDYMIALRHHPDPELQRRLALSLAISGRRDEALRAIDVQLRRGDRAGRRTQAFVLALTGDNAGANRIAQATMPPGMAGAMAPFLARLQRLSPSQKALAVNFGTIPNEGGPIRVATNSQSASATGGPATDSGTRPAAPASTPRRRPDVQVSPLERGAVGARQPLQVAQNDARPADPSPAPIRRFDPPPETRAADRAVEASVRSALAPTPQVSSPAQPPVPLPSPSQPAPSADAQAASDQGIQPVATPPAQGMPTSQVAASSALTPPSASPAMIGQATPAPTATPPSASMLTSPVATALPPSAVAPDNSSPGFTLVPRGVQPVVPQPVPQPAAPAARAPAAARTVLADIADLVNSLPTDEPNRPGVTLPRQAPAAANAGRTRTAAREATPPRNQRAAQPAHPSRHWVQIAGGANRTTLPREFSRLRDTAPALLRNRMPFVTSARATNRLLVGPFRSAAEAQDFVNQLARSNVAAFAWTSEAGQEIERLQMPR